MKNKRFAVDVITTSLCTTHKEINAGVQASMTSHVSMRLHTQVSLPSGLHVVGVSNGSVLLRAAGMYEVQLTLVPALPPPGTPTSTNSTAQPGANPTDTAAAMNVTASTSAVLQPSEGTSQPSAQPQPSPAAPQQQRWRWRLLAFSLVGGTPLQSSQHDQLLHNLNIRMDLAADAAVYAKHNLLPTPSSTAAAAALAAAQGKKPAVPSASGVSGMSVSISERVTTTSASAATATAQNCARSMLGLLQQHVADETTSPLISLHVILVDIAGKLGVDETTGVVKALLLPGGRWVGHIALQPSALLLPGVRISFWKQALPLVDLESTSNTASAPAAGVNIATEALTLPSIVARPAGGVLVFQPPFVEIGCGSNGLIEVLLQAHASGGGGAPSAAPQRAVLSLEGPPTPAALDALLLRAGCAAARGALSALESRLRITTQGLQGCTLRLTSISHRLRLGGEGGGRPPMVSIMRNSSPGHATQDAADPSCPDCSPCSVETSKHVPCGSCAGGAGKSGSLVEHNVLTQHHRRTSKEERVAMFPSSGCSGSGGSSGESSGGSSALVALDAPVLEVCLRGLLLLRLGCDLVTGRLVVLPGSQEGANVHLETFAAAAVVSTRLCLRIYCNYPGQGK